MCSDSGPNVSHHLSMASYWGYARVGAQIATPRQLILKIRQLAISRLGRSTASLVGLHCRRCFSSTYLDVDNHHVVNKLHR